MSFAHALYQLLIRPLELIFEVAYGVAIGLTYGKTLGESCVIGTRLAASVIATKENVCPRFRPEEFDLDPDRIGHLMTV